MEIWKDVPGFDGQYQASSLGRIKSKSKVVSKMHKSGKLINQLYKDKILTSKGDKNRRGVIGLHITHNGKNIHMFAHTMVLLAFVGERPDGMEACHNDGNASNNNIENLRWDSHLENNRDRLRHGTYKRGGDHHMSKIDIDTVKDIRSGKLNSKNSGIGISQFYRIKNKVSWKHVK